MYSMVLMAALTTGASAPDYLYFGFGGWGWPGWSSYGLGWNGSGGYGLGWNGWGGWDGWGWGYGGYGYSPLVGYAYSPVYSGWGWGAPYYSGGAFPNPGMTRSSYYNPAMDNPARTARLIVHLPPQASLTIDDYPTMSRSDTRVFTTPPLDPSKTYTYTLRGELNRDGRFVRVTKIVEVKGGQQSEVTLRFGDTNQEELGAPTPKSSSSK
jgi:uncharacterized protein (TIGR03000 family)